MTKRLISLLLAVLLAGGTLAACSESAAGNEGETEAVSAQPTSPEAAEPAEPEKDSLEAREDVSDGLPEKDFGGRIFCVAGDNGYTDWYLKMNLPTTRR